MDKLEIEKLASKILIDQFIKSEIAFLIFSLFCGSIIAYKLGIYIGFKMFLLFFLVPQPFFLYASRKQIIELIKKLAKN